MKKVKLWGIMLLLITLVLGFGVNYVFCEPTEINAFIAARIYHAPANVSFVDDNFYKVVVDEYNEQNGTSVPYTTNLSDEQLKTIKVLNVECELVYEDDDEYCSEATIINDLTGLEKLTSLISLDMSYLNVKTVDISSLTLLTDLTINYTNMMNIDLSKNINLENINLANNQLTNISVDNNLKLYELDVTSNPLTNLDVSKNVELENLYVSDTLLTNIDVSKNQKLKVLYIGDDFIDDSISYIASLNLKNNPLLTELSIDNVPIENIDLSNNTNLMWFSAVNTALTSLDVSKNSQLMDLDIHCSKVNNLNISGVDLSFLRVSGNPITSLDLSDAKSLVWLDAKDTELTELDLSENVELQSLHIGDALYYYSETSVTGKFKVSTLNLENNEQLEQLYINGATNLTSLNLSKNVNLFEIEINGVNIDSLDLSKNTLLEWVSMRDTKITDLDFSNIPLLKNLFISDVPLENLIFDSLDELTFLTLFNTNLKGIDISLAKKIDLESVSIKFNEFLEEFYVYKGEKVKVYNTVKLPDTFDVSDTLWLSSDSSKATVNEDGLVETHAGGIVKIYNNVRVCDDSCEDLYQVNKEIHIIEITSNKYEISDSKIIVTDTDNDTILSNIYVDNNVDLFIENDKLLVKYGDVLLKEFAIEYSDEPQDNLVQHFEDENLYKCVVDSYNDEYNTNISYDTLLSDKMLASIKGVSCYEEEVKNTKGIEKLTSLEVLDLQYIDELTEIDLSKNVNLIELTLGYNKLTKLNLQNNTLLEGIYIAGGLLTEIDLSKNVNLTSLGVSDNKLTELNLENNVNLVYLEAGGNDFTTLDLSKNTKLKHLDLGNELTSYDWHMLDMAYDPCMGGYGGYNTPSSPKLTQLNVGNNILLEDLYISGTSITEIDLSKNTNLVRLNVNDTLVSSLDLSKNIALETLRASNTPLENIVLGDAPLERLYMSNTKLTSLDLSEVQENIYELVMNDSPITELDLTLLYDLDELQMYGTNISTFDLSGNSALRYLYVGGNKLTKLDLKNNKSLLKVIIEDSLIKELDLSSINNVEALVVKNVPLERLILGNISNLNYIDITDTKLKDLDLSGMENSECFYINVENNTSSEKLYTYKGNNITVKEFVKFPEFYKPTITWSSTDSSKVTVNNEGVVETYTSGVVDIVSKIKKCDYDWNKQEDVCVDVVLETNSLNIVEITSDKYVIDELDGVVYIDSIDNLEDNILTSHKDVVIDVDTENNKLFVKYGNNLLKEFDLSIINLGENITSDENITLDESINVDESKKYFSNIDFSTNVDTIIDKISTDSEIIITNKNNKVITGDEKVGTGSKVTIKSDNVIYEYTIVIYGDTDGDGDLKLSDIMKIANYVYINKNTLNGAFKEAADYNKDKSYDLKDIMKTANKLYVEEGNN